MIKITIEQTSQETYPEVQNFVTHEEPTEQVKESEYGSTRREVIMKRDFQPKEVTKSRTVTRTLLAQEMADDDFPLVRVIAAINGIDLP